MIGKSALVASVADFLIEQEEIDYLVWIQQAQSMSHISNLIHDIDTNAWSDLLVQLQSAFAILVNHEKPILLQNVQPIEPDNLSQADAISLIRTYLTDRADAQFIKQTGKYSRYTC